MRKNALPILVICFLICTTGCSSVQKYFLKPSPVPLSGSVLFSDDFSTTDNEWKSWNEANAMVIYQAGGLHFLINEPDVVYWSRPGYKFEDVKIQADAIKVSGPNNNSFGVICRMVDDQNFYAFLISSDGYSGILRVFEGKFDLLNNADLEFSSAIAKGDSLNQITAECSGDRLSLAVNGQTLFQVQDATFTSGDVGFIATSYNEIGVDIIFDNMVVFQP